MQAAVVGLVLAASGVFRRFGVVSSTRFAPFFSCVAVLITFLWLGALPFFGGLFLPHAHGLRLELIRIPRLIGPCSLVVVALFSCSTVAFGHCYSGRGAQLPHEPWVFYQGQYDCGRLLLVFCRFAY